jgi:hypothetical protein
MTATARSTLNEALVKLTDLRAGERALVARIERIEQYRASAPARMDAAAMCLIEAGGYVAETNEDLTPLKEELGVRRRAIELQERTVALARSADAQERAAAMRPASEEQARKAVVALTGAVVALGKLAELRDRVPVFDLVNERERSGAPWLEDELRFHLERAAEAVVRALSQHLDRADVAPFHAAPKVRTPAHLQERRRIESLARR